MMMLHGYVENQKNNKEKLPSLLQEQDHDDGKLHSHACMLQ